jgi:hypothetical protein
VRLVSMSRLAAGVILLCALAACSGGSGGSCRQGESPTLIVRLLPRGASATHVNVYEGGSLTVAVALPSGQPIQSVRLHPSGPLVLGHGAMSAGQRLLLLRRGGTTKVSATDTTGAKFERVVAVHC